MKLFLVLKTSMKTPLFLYIHIPFCLQKCGYCNFTTLPWKQGELISPYMRALKKELHLRRQSLEKRTLKSIYLGGGTPSLIPSKELKNLFQEIQRYFIFSKKIEITIEINPGTLTEKQIDELVEIGVNRFSVGVQTFSSSLLKVCGRKHSPKDSHQILSLLQKKNLNFSCDLLFALPHQNLSSVQFDLKEMLSYSPPHISTYCLTLPPSHSLEKGRPHESQQIKMFEWIEKTLTQHFLFQYEISNFAKKDFKSIHNLSYWNDEEFWGLGVSSHSYLKNGNYGVRFWNSKNLQTYFQQLNSPSSQTPYEYLPPTQVEFLKEKEALGDFCHTSIRTSKGIQKHLIQKKFSSLSLRKIQEKLLPFEEKGLVIQDSSSWKLNFHGRMLSNQIISALVF